MGSQFPSANPGQPGFLDRGLGALVDFSQGIGRLYRGEPLTQPGDLTTVNNYHQMGTVRNAATPGPDYQNQVVDNGFVLDNYRTNQGLPPIPQTTPVLTNTAQDTPTDGILTGSVSANRRDTAPLARQPQSISMNEMLIRTGLAGLGANSQGFTGTLGAMGKTYGAIEDYNRSALNKYNLEMAKAEAKAKGKKAGGSGVGQSGSLIVNDAIARAMPLIGDGWATGFASYLKDLPGTDAQKLANNLKTIQANIGFDKLQAMRDASPTGGALGQVSERELGFLQSVFGSLEQSQSAEELSYNLRLLQHVYNNIVHGEGNHSFGMPTYGGVASGPAQASGSNFDAADALVGIK